MRRIRLIPALLAFLLCACTENIIQDWPTEPAGDMGTVRIALSTDMANSTKADAEEPNLDDFRVAIYAGDTKMRLFNDSYANILNRTTPIKLNSKEHRLVAQHGDSLGCGFNKAYYLADKTFNVVKGENTVEAVAKLANVKVGIVYDETISETYSDYKVVVKHNTFTGKSITFSKNETRYGYIPGGELTLEIWAIIDGTWKVYSTVPGKYAPNDFVTFTITTDASEGSMVVNISVDNSVEVKEETIEIPAYTTPQEAPSITLAGFDGTGNIHEFIEGVAEGNNATASFIARGSLKNCILTISSEYLKNKGIPSEVDFTNISSDLKAQLKAAGFVWDENMKESRTFSWIDFSGVIAKMYAETKSAAKDVVMAGFSLKIVDAVKKEATSSFSIVSGSVQPTLDIKDYNVWAKKIVNSVATINKGNVSLVKYQYSLDQRNWTDFNVTPSQNAYTLTYETVPVEAGTTYYLRTIYNGNTACVSPVVTVATEAAAQIVNNGFEDWTVLTHNFMYDFGIIETEHNINWYYPNSGWAVNSKKTMPNKTAVLSAYWDCIRFPMVAYTVDSYSGSKAAMVYSVSVGDASSPGVKGTNNNIGELWTGTADESGNHSSDTGVTLNSRPMSISFAYKYKSVDGEKFTFTAILKNGSKTIASAAVQGGSASAWTRCTLPFDYNDLTTKVTSVYIQFKSSNGSSPAIDTDSDVVIANNESHNGNFGSVLYIDDIQMAY